MNRQSDPSYYCSHQRYWETESLNSPKQDVYVSSPKLCWKVSPNMSFCPRRNSMDWTWSTTSLPWCFYFKRKGMSARTIHARQTQQNLWSIIPYHRPVVKIRLSTCTPSPDSRAPINFWAVTCDPIQTDVTKLGLEIAGKSEKHSCITRQSHNISSCRLPTFITNPPKFSLPAFILSTILLQYYNSIITVAFTRS